MSALKVEYAWDFNKVTDHMHGQLIIPLFIIDVPCYSLMLPAVLTLPRNDRVSTENLIK